MDGLTRRDVLRAAGAGLVTAAALPRDARAGRGGGEAMFRISLAQWSLHRTLRAGELDPIDFPKVARETYGIEAVEYVNTFFAAKAKDRAWLADLSRRAADHGVKSLLIMVDAEGDLGDADAKERARAIENHRKWLEAAKALGCHSIRVNARSTGTWEEQASRAADGLARLAVLGEEHGLHVLVENHGGLSSNGRWLAEVIGRAGHRRLGTLPDFGNFRVSEKETYDRYEGVKELMPFAKAVSAKSHEFDATGNEINTDYRRMMKIVLDAGYRGYVGIEYEGSRHAEAEGIRLTKALLERVREELGRG